MSPRVLVLAIAAVVARAAPVHAGNAIVFGDTGATASHDCAVQPSVVISGARNTIALTGTCAKVQINGIGNIVTAATVTALVVTGSTNSVTVDSAGKIAVTGTDNRVSWKLGKKPKVTSRGIDNEVVRAK